MDKNRIPKLIITADQIESNWGLRQEEQITTCQYCGGMIFYVEKILGVTAEENDYKIMGWRSKRNYSLTEIGLDIFCAECGKHSEGYHTFQYDKDAVVCAYDDIDGEEKEAIDFCLRQFNEKGDFTPPYHTAELKVLKKKLMDYEKKHPIKKEKAKKKKGKIKKSGSHKKVKMKGGIKK